jgi:2',3'-cyclic-nucleotide 2'-phosphodiesterase/3'-nucleotidase/5'-nucleotidase
MQKFTSIFCICLFFYGIMLFSGGLTAQPIQLSVLGTYDSGVFDEGAAESLAFDPQDDKLFVTNADGNSLDVLDLSNPASPTLIKTIDLSPYGGGPNSVAVFYNIVAVAVEANNKQDPGSVVFFDRQGNFKNQLTVGALPDMLTFTPNGKFLLVANEGEPNDEYTVDPVGSVSIIRIKGNPAKYGQNRVKTVGFSAFLNNYPADVRVFGPGANLMQDLEPEYIAVSRNSRTAWVVMQENNAIAKVGITGRRIRDIYALGYKDHMDPANKLDASNRDDAINIQNWPIYGMYMPDAMASFRYAGDDYLITANEGDSRDYDGYSEEERVEDVTLDPTAFPNAADLQDEDSLGRIKITTSMGDTDGDGDFDELYSYGGRSFAIWSGSGNLIFDSGDELAQISAAAFPSDFNSTNDENGSFDNRSDDKGTEPEGVAVGKINGATYAFIGLERMGGVMVYDISDPYAPVFVQYINNRDYSGDAELGTAGDLGPEILAFIEAGDSPNGQPLLVVSNEVSGTVTTYGITVPTAAPVRKAQISEATVQISQNYPNPVVDRTTIDLELPEAMPVRLLIFNMNGQLVKTLADHTMKSGEQAITWDARNQQGSRVPAGIYFYRLEAGNSLIVRKMIVR